MKQQFSYEKWLKDSIMVVDLLANTARMLYRNINYLQSICPMSTYICPISTKNTCMAIWLSVFYLSVINIFSEVESYL